ncbi:hypothetical protein KP509_14G056200 [Ceratopteris richardii]|nr:hypothetical protein KP509_14G056200 [Ceratopteris richardii]
MRRDCESGEDATGQFSETHYHMTEVWNSMMTIYMRQRSYPEAFHLFQKMLQEGIIPDMGTYISLLSVCAGLTSIVEGRHTHARIMGTGYYIDVFVSTSLVNLYGKFGESKCALQQFDAMPHRSTVTWNALISGYKQNKQCKQVLQLFGQILLECVLPSSATFACVLSACATEGLRFQGKLVHVLLKGGGFESDFVVSNALVHMYSQSCSLEEAQGVFNALLARSMVAAKAMVAAYIHYGCLSDALQLLIRMQNEGRSIESTNFIQLLDMCRSQGASALPEARKVHSLIKSSGLTRNTVVGNSLISTYGKCQSLADAQQVFDEILDKDVVTWNAMIAVYIENDYWNEGVKTFYQMQQVAIFPNEVTFICLLDLNSNRTELLYTPWFQIVLWHSGFCSETALATALVNAYSKGGSLASACNIFDIMQDPNVISWTTMISSYSSFSQDIEALQIFKQMLQQGGLPDTVTFMTILNVGASLGSILEGKILHVYVKLCHVEVECSIANGLINMYGKCGFVDVALDIFNRVSSCSLETWNIMIGIHAQHGGAAEAHYLLWCLRQAGLVPDKITLVNYLSACSHAGYVEAALDYVLSSCTDTCDIHQGAMPTLQHYDCIVDVLGRAGQLDRIQCVISTLPFQLSGLSWMTVLSVCRDLLTEGQAEFIAKHVLELDPLLLGFS